MIFIIFGLSSAEKMFVLFPGIVESSSKKFEMNISTDDWKESNKDQSDLLWFVKYKNGVFEMVCACF